MIFATGKDAKKLEEEAEIEAKENGYSPIEFSWRRLLASGFIGFCVGGTLAILADCVKGRDTL